MSACEDCNKCELGALQEGRSYINYMKGTGPTDAKIMIVGDAPGPQDAANGKPFDSEAGSELKAIFRDLGIDWKSVYKTTAIKCRPPKKANAKHIKECMPYLEDEVALVKPNLIVSLGAVPLQVLTGKTGITKVRGQVTEVEFGGHKCLVLPTYHPAAIFMNPEYRPDWEADLSKILQYQDMTELPRKKVKYVTTWTFEEAKKVLKQWKKEKLYAYDLETKGTNPWNIDAKVLCISVSWKANTGFTIPLSHRETPFKYSELEYIAKEMKEILEMQDSIKVAHNGKFDMKWLLKMYRIKLSGDWLIDIDDYTKFQPSWDTMLAHHILDSTKGTHGLKPLASKLLGMEDYDAKLKEYLKSEETEDNAELDYEKPPAEVLFEYAAADVDATLQLYHMFKEQLAENSDFDWIANNITMPVNEVLTAMEYAGAPVDVPYLAQLGKDLDEEIKQLNVEILEFDEAVKFAEERKIRLYMEYIVSAYKEQFRPNFVSMLGLDPDISNADMVKAVSKCSKYKKAETVKERRALEKVYKLLRPYAIELIRKGKIKGMTTKSRKRLPKEEDYKVNLKSNDQLQELLFDKDYFGLPTPTDFEGEPMLTDAGNPSTDKEALGMLAGEDYKIADVMLRFRTAEKYYGTFYTGIKEKLDDENRVHPTFNIHGTASGRLSCSNPNLQQIPRDKKIKNVFRAPDGYKLVQADFSQAELRTAAILSHDRNMRESYIKGIDLHKRTAARTKVIQGIDKEMNMDGVTKDERQEAKISNFGIIYGRTDVGLSKELKIALKAAQAYIKSIFTEYKDLKKWIDAMQAKARKEGKSASKFGRVRWLPAAKLGKGPKQSEAMRQSVNHAVQSTASDITLLNIIRLYIVFKRLELDARLIITVHDSIIAEASDEDVDTVCLVMKEVMETPIADWIDIPWVADVEFGQSWGALKPHYEDHNCPECEEKGTLHVRHTTETVECTSCDFSPKYETYTGYVKKQEEFKKLANKSTSKDRDEKRKAKKDLQELLDSFSIEDADEFDFFLYEKHIKRSERALRKGSSKSKGVKKKAFKLA